MKEPIFITSEGILFREANTLYFMNEENGKKPLPIENISDIYCYGKVSLKSGGEYLLMEQGIPVHFFNKYGYYMGSLYPKMELNSGQLLVKQAEYYLDSNKRAEIAIEMVNGIKHNILQTLKYYKKKKKDVDSYIKAIEKENPSGDIATIMSAEGRIWAEYYKSFNEILNFFEMSKREIRPPTNELNSLISFGNSLLYSTTLSEIYNTYLHL